MYPTGQELFEDSESYLSELNDDTFDSSIDGFEVIYGIMLESFNIPHNISLAAINIAALAVSTPDCDSKLYLNANSKDIYTRLDLREPQLCIL